MHEDKTAWYATLLDFCCFDSQVCTGDYNIDKARNKLFAMKDDSMNHIKHEC